METRTETGPGAPLPPTLVYVLGFLFGWGIDRLFGWGVERLAPVGPDAGAPTGMVVVGWLLAAAGSVLFVWGLSTFATIGTGIMLQRAATRVVFEGPYKWSRNPMYVGFTLIYVGAAWILGLLWPLVFLPAVILVLNMAVIAREERYMRGAFGQDYDAYCQRVRRWV